MGRRQLQGQGQAVQGDADLCHVARVVPGQLEVGDHRADAFHEQRYRRAVRHRQR